MIVARLASVVRPSSVAHISLAGIAVEPTNRSAIAMHTIATKSSVKRRVCMMFCLILLKFVVVVKILLLTTHY